MRGLGADNEGARRKKRSEQSHAYGTRPSPHCGKDSVHAGVPPLPLGVELATKCRDAA